MNIEAKLEKFRTLAAKAKEIKAQEMELRKEICDELLEGKDKGTHNFTYLGLNVKAVKKFTMRLDNKMLTDRLSDLSDAEKDCIKFTPSLSLSVYNKTTSDLPLLNECVTVTLAAPTLEVTLS